MNFIHLYEEKNIMIKKTLIISSIICSVTAFTQNNEWLSFPVATDSIKIEKIELDYSSSEGKVNIKKDDRITALEKFVRAGEESIEGVLIDGYRVLIYFDQDKTKSEQQKARFMNIYDDYRTYIDYLAPNYRVRVGNFRTKLEAIRLKQEILAIFPTAIVVEDKIQLPTITSKNGE